jgi:DNA-binding NtrC family response regulator
LQRNDIEARLSQPNLVAMGNSHDIVVYERDSLTRTLLQEWLGEAGYRVRIGDPCDAPGDAPCALVIMSVYMPKQAGAQCVRDVQTAHPGTPLIAISGQFRAGLPAAGAAAQMLRVQQVVAKPLSRNELLQSVRDIIG